MVSANYNLPLKDGWRFHPGEFERVTDFPVSLSHATSKAGGALKALDGFEDKALWKDVCVPHDWLTELKLDEKEITADGFKQRATGWYLISFKLGEDEIKNARVMIGDDGDRIPNSADPRAFIGHIGESNIAENKFYPGENGNQLLYARNGSPNYGVETLPRLIYNYWILLGAAATLGGFAVYFMLRKKYYADRILKTVLIPLSFTISTVLVLIGKSRQVYNAVYYLSGILLLSFLIYVLLLYCLNQIRQKE